jgi:hypothetical protein
MRIEALSRYAGEIRYSVVDNRATYLRVGVKVEGRFGARGVEQPTDISKYALPQSR